MKGLFLGLSISLTEELGCLSFYVISYRNW